MGGTSMHVIRRRLSHSGPPFHDLFKLVFGNRRPVPGSSSGHGFHPLQPTDMAIHSLRVGLGTIDLPTRFFKEASLTGNSDMSQPNAKQLLELDPLFSNKVRLAIVVTLVTADAPLDFNSILEKLGLSKGNLSSHMRKMEEAGYVEAHKEFLDRKPRTTYTLTSRGKDEMRTYLDTLESILKISL